MPKINERGVVHILLIIAAVGIISFLLITSLAPFKDGLWAKLFLKQFSFASAITNLLTNGDFESDFTDWPVNTTNWSITQDAYSGQKSAQFKGAAGSAVRRSITLQVGKTYKVSYWLKLNNSTCTSDCWGWVSSNIVNFPNLTFQVSPFLVNPSNTTIGVWQKYSYQFKVNGPQNSGEIEFGPFSGSGWNWDYQLDDVKLFELPLTPLPPHIDSMSADKTSITSVSDTISFNSRADDDDGSVNYYFWDFGDGGKSNIQNPQHNYISNGLYKARLIVYDDSGLSAQSETTITVADPSLPTLTISAPTQTTSSNPNISFSGSSQGGTGKVISKIEYSTDRGMIGTASGTTNWNFSLDLSNYLGTSKVLIASTDNAGNVVSKSLDVTYKPATKVSVKNGSAGVVQNSSQVELYDKFEATFDLQNAVFSNPYVPFETNLSGGLKEQIEGKGVTLEATFKSPSGKIYTQPAFLYQPYQKVAPTQQLIPSGAPQWKVRFSPTELGQWTYTISVTDASGNSVLTDNSKLTFNTTAQTNPLNHGFLQVSQKDKRYFEFTDGTPFVGVGPGPVLDNIFGIDAEMAKFAPGSGNLSRTWMSGHNISGSSWAPWTGGIGNVSNSPGTSLTTEQAYGEGIYSFTLPTEGPGSDPANPSKCTFYGFNGTKVSVKQNTNYRIFARLKTVGITGSGGFTIRPLGPNWPNDCNSFAGQPLTIPYQKGTQDWHVVSGNWNSGQETKLGNLLMTLENNTAGRVYIDEISLQEDLGNGQFGPEVLARSKFNVQNYFSQEPSYSWDYGLDEFAKRGIYEKVVIQEKDDYAYNYISPYGYGYDKGNQLGMIGGASMKYQEYFWRYLTARWGYSRAVHSWEFANEQAPGTLGQAEELAKYMKSSDPNKHMATSSNWAGLDGGWTDPLFADVSNADVHSYTTTVSDNSTFLPNGIDPITNVFSGDDSAVFSAGHSLYAYSQNKSGNRPWIMGEAGLGKNGVTAGNNDSQTKGDWFHQFVWAQLNSGGMYFIYWYDQTIKSNNLSSLVVPYRSFLEGKPSDTVNTRVPLNNGSYSDIQLTVPTELRGWGQKDIINGGAHFWVYDKSYTWTNPAGGSNVGGKTISFSGLPAKQYTVEFWDTWNQTVTKQTINHGGGNMSLTIPSTLAQKDVAVKIYPTTGYISTQITQSPTPVPTSSKPGDIDNNGKVDIFDYNILLTNFGRTGSGIQGDLDNNGKVDIFDYNILLTNFGK